MAAAAAAARRALPRRLLSVLPEVHPLHLAEDLKVEAVVCSFPWCKRGATEGEMIGAVIPTGDTVMLVVCWRVACLILVSL